METTVSEDPSLGQRMQTLPTELQEMIFDYCGIFVMKRIRLAGRGYWHDTVTRILFSYLDISFRPVSRANEISSNILSLCRHADTSLWIDTIPPLDLKDALAQNRMTMQLLSLMPKLKSVRMTIALPNVTMDSPAWAQAEILYQLQAFGRLPTRPYFRKLKIETGNFQLLHILCSSVSSTSVHELWIQAYYNAPVHDVSSTDNLEPLNLRVNKLTLERSSSVKLIQDKCTRLLQMDGINSLQLLELKVWSSTTPLARALTHVTSLEWTEPPLSEPRSWDSAFSSLRSLDSHIEESSIALILANSASIQSLNISLQNSNLLEKLLKAVSTCCNLQILDFCMETSDLEDDWHSFPLLGDLLEHCEIHNISFSLIAQHVYTGSLQACLARLRALSTHMWGLTLLQSSEENHHAALPHASGSGALPARFDGHTSLNTPMNFANLAHLYMQLDDTHTFSSTSSTSPIQEALAVLRFAFMPNLATLRLEFTSLGTDYIKDVARIIASDCLPQFEELNGSFYIDVEEDGTVLKWQDALGPRLRTLLETACDARDIERTCRWRSGYDGHDELF